MYYDAILITSILLRLAAGVWAARLTFQQRDWRLGFLAVMILLMAVRQTLTLVTTDQPHEVHLPEIAGLLVSFLVFPAVYFLDRLLAERRDAIRRLRVNEERYRSLVEDQVDLVCRFDPDFTLTYVNRSYAEYFGKTVEQLTGTSFLALIPVESHEQLQTHVASFGPDNLVSRIVHEVMTDNGVRWQEWTDHAFVDESGTVVGFQSIGRDITDRKSAEDSLRQSEELNRRIVEAIPGGIVHVDRDGRILRANREAQRILGIGSEQLAEANINDLEPWTVYESGVTCPKDEFPAAKCLATGQKQPPVVLGTLRPTGEISWAIYTAVPVLNPDTQLLDGVVLTFLDITERRLAEDALRDSEANHRAMVRAVPDTMFRVSRDGVFIDFIPADGFELVTGPDRFLGRPLDKVLPENVATRALKTIKAALRTNELRGFEYQLELRDRVRHYEARVVPDRSESVLILVRDISERRTAEIERERLLLELEEKNRELERFARTVSHDLKSPLITIRGFLEVLVDERESVSRRAGQAIDRINTAARMMLQLLDELLELARVGRLVNPSELFPLGSLVRAAVDQSAGRIVKAGVSVDVKPDLPYVFGDRIRLLQVMQNLVENAIKFMGDQRNPRIEIGATERPGDVLCYVKDNGSGVDPRNLDRIFGVFDRLDRDVDGSGLGLAIVKRIVEAHGGQVWADSEGLKKGTTVYFNLPKDGSHEVRRSTGSAA